MVKKKKSKKVCSINSCCGKFPLFAILLLVAGVMWLLRDLGAIAFKLPWLPIIIILIALKMLSKRLCKKC